MKYEYMNGVIVKVNKNGTPIELLWQNGLCFSCERELLAERLEKSNYCEKCEKKMEKK